MKRNLIWQEIELKVRASRRELTSFPDHPAAQAGLVVKEAGDLMEACLEWKYNREPLTKLQKRQQEEMKESAVRTAAMAIRFLENLK